MIVKRNRPPKKPTSVPRMIVRRGHRPEVGEARQRPDTNPHRIVRRQNAGGVQPRHVPDPPKVNLLVAILWGWRPGWRTWTALTATALVAGIAWGGYWAWTTPYFRISNFEVAGANTIPADIIVATTNLGGERIMTADLEAAQERLYNLPLLATARVEREFPSTVRIIIEERQPWGTWEQSGVPYTIDREGVVLGTAQPVPGRPVILSSQLGSRVQGDRVDYQAVDAAAELYELLPRQLGVTVTEIAYLPSRGLQVTTDRGETAIFGDSSSIEYKVAVWAAMAERARTEHITYTVIDLRYGNRPVLQ